MDDNMAMLKECGLVRVDGLWFSSIITSEGGDRIRRNPGNKYRYASNNGKSVIATPEGEVWVGSLPAGEVVVKKMSDSGHELEHGCYVPLSNGEQANLTDILFRMHNPEWVPNR